MRKHFKLKLFFILLGRAISILFIEYGIARTWPSNIIFFRNDMTQAIFILFFENDIAVFVRIIVEAENFKYIIYKLTKNKSLAKQVYIGNYITINCLIIK